MAEESWFHLLQQAIQEIKSIAPANSNIILVDDASWGIGDNLEGRRITPFLEEDGLYMGPPKNDTKAILELEQKRKEGSEYIVFAWRSFWWLDHYEKLHKFLRSHYSCLLENDRVIIFNLKELKDEDIYKKDILNEEHLHDLESKNELPIKDIFKDIYVKNTWSSKESVSGSGSELSQTVKLRSELCEFIREENVLKIVDAPCGDFNWMKDILPEDVEYLGVDIVEDIINNNKQLYPKYKFEVGNILNYSFPKSDLILCRDCLVHMRFKDISTFFTHLIDFDFTYLAVTNFIDDKRLNKDISTGEWRALNFYKSPFNFPKPYFNVVEECTEFQGYYSDKSLSIFTKEQLKDAVNNITVNT